MILCNELGGWELKKLGAHLDAQEALPGLTASKG